jgi:hypothetical protein
MGSSDWVQFFELVERLQDVSPGLVELALRYGRSKNQEVLKEVERELRDRHAGESLREPFFAPAEQAHKVNLRACEEFLGHLRKQEDTLRESQAKTTQELLQVQAARRAFEETLKEMLRAETRAFASLRGTMVLASEEEVIAGLQELKEKGGLELHEFISDLEQVLQDDERAGK